VSLTKGLPSPRSCSQPTGRRSLARTLGLVAAQDSYFRTMRTLWVAAVIVWFWGTLAGSLLVLAVLTTAGSLLLWRRAERWRAALQSLRYRGPTHSRTAVLASAVLAGMLGVAMLPFPDLALWALPLGSALLLVLAVAIYTATRDIWLIVKDGEVLGRLRLAERVCLYGLLPLACFYATALGMGLWDQAIAWYWSFRDLFIILLALPLAALLWLPYHLLDYGLDVERVVVALTGEWLPSGRGGSPRGPQVPVFAGRYGENVIRYCREEEMRVTPHRRQGHWLPAATGHAERRD